MHYGSFQAMKEKIYQYLQNQENGVPSAELLEIFFHTFTSQSSKVENIIDLLLEKDDRFVRDQQGCWRVRQVEQNFNDAIFSIVEFLTVQVNKKEEIAVLLGVAQVQHFKKIYSKIFKIEQSAYLSDDLLQKIDEIQRNEETAETVAVNWEDLSDQLANTVLFSIAPAKKLNIVNSLAVRTGAEEIRLQKISLKLLAKKLFPGLKFSSLEQLAERLNITYNSPLSFSARLDLMADVLILFLRELEEFEFSNFAELESYLQETDQWIDFSQYEFNAEFIKKLPTTPGVYFFLNEHDQIFYVGKAKNLQRRVSSYFVNRTEWDEKGKYIIDNIRKIDYRLVGSELEALLIENQAIHEFAPSLNVQVKIHPFHVDKYKRKHYILFLPAADAGKVMLLFLYGTKRAVSQAVQADDEDLLRILNENVAEFFFLPKGEKSAYSAEQIEIIWRWFDANKKYINYLDADQFSGAVACTDVIVSYLNDRELFSSPILYVES